jgi:hypothetical protein
MHSAHIPCFWWISRFILEQARGYSTPFCWVFPILCGSCSWTARRSAKTHDCWVYRLGFSWKKTLGDTHFCQWDSPPWNYFDWPSQPSALWIAAAANLVETPVWVYPWVWPGFTTCADPWLRNHRRIGNKNSCECNMQVSYKSTE